VRDIRFFVLCYALRPNTMTGERHMKTTLVLLLAMLGSGCGYSSHRTTPPQPGIVPVIAEIMPDSANHGDPAFPLTVNGSSFNANAVVNWNGMAQTTSHPATNQLVAMIPASAIATAGTVPVTVTNPGSSTPGGPYGGGGSTMSQTSAPMNFTVH
jgi:hypothetical protein